MACVQSGSQSANHRLPGHVGRDHYREPAKQPPQQHHLPVPDPASSKCNWCFSVFTPLLVITVKVVCPDTTRDQLSYKVGNLAFATGQYVLSFHCTASGGGEGDLGITQSWPPA